MLSAMLSRYPDLPVLDTGSAGGIYGPQVFDGLKRPFVDAPMERRTVVPGDHFASLPSCMAAYLSRVLPKVKAL
jgi:hypothetical protein